MHANSLESYWSGKRGLFSKRQQQILDFLRAHDSSTDRGIAQQLGFPDMNSVRPRISELLTAGVLEECGTILDPVTLKHVRRVRIKADPRRPQREFDLGLALQKACGDHRVGDDWADH